MHPELLRCLHTFGAETLLLVPPTGDRFLVAGLKAQVLLILPVGGVHFDFLKKDFPLFRVFSCKILQLRGGGAKEDLFVNTVNKKTTDHLKE